MSESARPPPGWVALLNGDAVDLGDWGRSLKQPFDPYCEQIAHGGGSAWALRSRQFDTLSDADDVRQRAIPLIEQLNGALAVTARAERVTLNGVGRIDEQGECHLTVFASLATGLGRARVTAFATIEIRDQAGNLVPPPPPEPSDPQKWIRLAGQSDIVADMLVFAGRGDNWFDIYKCIELAEKLVGGQHKLRTLLGSSAQQFKQMRKTANFHRHARGERPKTLTTLIEAQSLLWFVVRFVLDQQACQ